MRQPVPAGSPAPESPPNVLFILSDHQGPWAAGCYGNPEIRTPNLDRLAVTGVRFERSFVATPVCSPSRATYLTGLIPSQHGIHDWPYSGDRPELKNYNVGPDARPLLGGQVGWTDILAPHGYRCAISGKWHPGDSLRPSTGWTSGSCTSEGAGPTTTPRWCATGGR